MGNEDHIEIDADFEQFEWLKNYCPYFEMDAKNIEILETPTEFYNVLKVSSLSLSCYISNHH